MLYYICITIKFSFCLTGFSRTGLEEDRGKLRMPNLIPMKSNARTHKRLREAREADKLRLITKIGIELEDAPLFNEELRFLAYEESLRV